MTGTKREFRLRNENNQLCGNVEKLIRQTITRIDKEIDREIDKPSQRTVSQLASVSSLRESSSANTDYLIASLQQLEQINASFGF